jgi:nodulation protein E
MSSGRRVFITGMGAVSAAGVGAKVLWQAARDGRSCVGEIRLPRPHRGRIKIAAQVNDFDPKAYLDAKLLPFLDPVTQYLLVAADEAVAQSGISRDVLAGARTASIIGTGIAGMTTIEEGHYQIFIQNGRPELLTIPKLIPSSCPSNVSMRFGTTGPCLAVGSACSSATQAIGLGAQMIRFGLADRALVGGTEDCITSGTMLSWEALRVLTPDFCRPFSKNRNGMVIGAGAGVFLLEAEDVARERHATPLAELAGYGTSSDAKDHVRPDATGAAAAMQYALQDADVPAEAIDYINAHGTGTVVNDLTESEAIGMVFGKRAQIVPVSSTKPIHGHGLGAGGALELVVTIGAVRESVAPPTINWSLADEKCPVDAIPNEARPLPINLAMSNSFAFGGINAVLIVRKIEAWGA